MLLLCLLGLLLGQLGLNLRVFGFYLVAALPYLQLLLLVVFNLALGLGYLGHLHLLLVVDHDVLPLEQLKVLLELLLPLLTLVDLRVQVVDLSDQRMVLYELLLLLIAL